MWKSSRLSRLRASFSRTDRGVQLNASFNNDVTREFLEGKDHWDFYILFPFVAAFGDRETVIEKCALMTKVNKKYKELSNILFRPEARKIWG